MFVSALYVTFHGRSRADFSSLGSHSHNATTHNNIFDPHHSSEEISAVVSSDK